ncbi:AAA family ATPase [Cupriavidus sp. AU9028]|uniref:AAA family ATPase n=1 Tax=Cupriavidus sp. AU9028 TaxID=2871157 RepID=UPI001C93DD1C|nr:AAA family ATPase [Cupriavidus sp. AU9028]MBY4896103.1 AAA family ATPase [Cupriavidus sp. AU9028]
MPETSWTSPASEPSIVEHFSIEGLYGYRTVSLASKYAATILIARNGAGKTTLLGALDAFLKGQFYRLASVEFSTINCKLRGVDDLLTLDKQDVEAIAAPPSNKDLLRTAATIDASPSDLYEFIQSDYIKRLSRGETINFGESEIHDSLMRSVVRYDRDEIVRLANSLLSSVEEAHPRIADVRKKVRAALEGAEVVYLPTYRRIELPLPAEDSDEILFRRRKSVSELLNISKNGLFSGDINFGLSDISERLTWLNERLVNEANRGYSKISADIINELISGALDREEPDVPERPSKESLNLFFARLKSARRRSHSDIAIPKFDNIYDRSISYESNRFLTYFLSKLNQVIKATRDIDLMVDGFVESCNRYLSSEDLSTEIGRLKARNRGSISTDDKYLLLDREALKVNVVSVRTGRKISIESLSSGEKQMISLFAKLYLYPGKKIILVDEPELSMSMDWQRKILVDVISAPLCSQVVAITHSPFVFDNELEPYAKPLFLRIDADAVRRLHRTEDESNG